MSAASEAPAGFSYSAASPGPISLLRQAILDVLSRRRLVRYLVEAEMRKRGANTILGNIWWVLDPLLLMAVYVLLVTIIARRPVPDYPLFIFAAILPWKWFSSAVVDATSSVVSQQRLIRQIAFPKILLPVAATTSGLVGLAFGLIPLMAMMVFFLPRLSPLILLLPIIAAVQYVFTLGVAFLVAAGNVFVRDLGNLVRHLLRVWFYLSPGLYSLAQLEEIGFVRDNPVIYGIAMANPFAVLFEAYRAIIYGTPEGPPIMPDWSSLGILFAASLAFVALAAIVFKRAEPSFAKVL